MTQENKYPHLHLKDWPFQVVPDERFERIWADRRLVLEDIHLILNSLSRREQSAINLVWAWYGAGKSHTLRHMQFLCNNAYTKILPIYTELPRRINSFLDLYVFFIEAVGKDKVKELAVDVYLKHSGIELVKKFEHFYEEFWRMLELLASGSDEDEIAAWRWLSVKSLKSAEFKKFGIAKRIESSDDAVRAMAGLIQLIKSSGRYTRTMWMIDEFQRIGSIPREIFDDVNSSLHSVFNASPLGFSLFLSFSVHKQEDIYKYLSKEIQDRIGISKIISIPKMNEQEALVFVSDLLFEFRPDKFISLDPFSPFTEEAVKYIILLIQQTAELKPRSLMQYFNAILERAEPQIEMGQQALIDVPFIKNVFISNQSFYVLKEELV